MKVRTVLLAGMVEDASKAQHVATNKLWRWRRRATNPQFRKREADYQREWRKNNPEKLAEQQRRYQKKNRAKLREYHRNYYYRNLEKLRPYKAAWARKNHDQRRTKGEAGNQTETAARSVEALVCES